jgi:uncharacterized LabA/DUF88 family protein
MKSINVLVDVSNVYHCVGHRFGNRKLSYAKYLDFVSDLGEVKKRIAYGSQDQTEAHRFITSLKYIGFKPRFKGLKRMGNKRKSDWDVGMAIDMVKMADSEDRPDIIILGSADSDMAPAVEYVMGLGVAVIVFACGVASELYDTATEVIEITESMLEDK